jgi:hypothetical protein
MSNYIKSTDFAAKDLLLTGAEAKKVKGSEIDDEYNSIETAIGTKANTVSPTFTGTPLAPTAGAGTNSTQLATTAFVTTADDLKADLNGDATESFSATTAAVGTDTTQVATTAYVQAEFTAANINAMAYPIDSIYTAIVSTNPATLLGVGTWTAFATGRMLIGLDSGDTDFDTVEETGGAKTHTLTTAEMPSHTHSTTAYANVAGHVLEDGSGHDHNLLSTAITSTSTGSGNAHNNMPPYIAVYMWKRTA